MPRHHTIWDAKTQTQRDITFTPDEERARDQEERANNMARDAAADSETARSALTDRIGSDSATLKDVLAFLRSV